MNVEITWNEGTETLNLPAEESEFFRNVSEKLATLPIPNTAPEDKEKYPNYNIGYTLKEWEKEFPRIDTQKIFYPPVDVMTGMVYYDPEKLILIDTNIFGNQILILNPGLSAEESLLKVIHSYEQLCNQKEWSRILLGYRGSIMFHFLKEIIVREPATPKLYRLFIDFYSFEDYGLAVLGTSIISKVISGKGAEQIDETKKSLEGLEDIITVYRGEAECSTPYEKAYSWTLDINTAYFFATRHGEKKFRILTAQIKKKDIIEYIKDRGEEEILALPENIFNVKEKRLPNLKQLLYKNAKDRTFVKRLTEYLLMLYSMAPKNKAESSIHQNGHVSRVLFWTLVLAKDNKISDLETEKLCMAAVFHYCGRINDLEDCKHGYRSARLYNKIVGQDDVVEFLIENHCIDDAEVRKKLKGLHPSKRELVWKMLCILKDADGLDRVRLGLRALDVKYLRTHTASYYVAGARQLVNQDLSKVIDKG